MMVPMKSLSLPIVAESPTCQYTWQSESRRDARDPPPGRRRRPPAPLLVTRTDDLAAVVSVVPTWKTKTASGSPWASSTSSPVNVAAVAGKQ